MVDFFNTLLAPIMWGEAWVMLAWQKAFAFIGIGGGWSWALAIVGLTIVVRIVLIPLFVKQIHASSGRSSSSRRCRDPGQVQGQERSEVAPGDDPGDDEL